MKVIDELNIFPLIAQAIAEVFPGSTCYVKGSRLGNKPGNKFDFDVIVLQHQYTGKEYIPNVRKMYNMLKPMQEKFKETMVDEFGTPVRIDVFFVRENPCKDEPWREIKIDKITNSK